MTGLQVWQRRRNRPPSWALLTLPAGSRGASSGGSGGSFRPTAAPDASPAEEAALRRAVEFELIGPLPNDADYWIQLALPAMLCVGIVARAVV